MKRDDEDQVRQERTQTASILDKAREVAAKKAVEKQQQEEHARAEATRLNEQLVQMKSLLVDEIRKLDGVECAHGKFKLEMRDDHGGYYVFAHIVAAIGPGRFERKVAWFKAGIVSGTYDASDDCRNIPFTSPMITMRIYPPNPSGDHNGDWDELEQRYYHNGGWTISADSVASMPRFFERFAELLAQWVGA